MTHLCSMFLLVVFLRVSIASTPFNAFSAVQEEMWDELQVVDSPLYPEYARAKGVYTNLIVATYLRMAKKLSHAKRAYEQILREHETSAYVHTELASLSLRMQNVPLAERECRRAIELDPEKPTPHFLLGEILIRYLRHSRDKSRDKWGDIIAAFQKVVELDPDHVEAYQYLGRIAEQMEDYKSAIDAFKELTRIMPYQPFFYQRLGSFYKQLGNRQEAIAAYERAVKINRDLWDVYETLGPLYVEEFDQLYSQDQLVLAAETLEKAIHSYAELRRFATSRDHQNYDDLLAHFRTRLGSIYVTRQMDEKANAVLEQVLETDPNNVEANSWLGIAYQERGDFERAESYLSKAIEIAPLRVGHLYIILRKYEAAIEVLQKALEDDSDNIDANYWIGIAYQELGILDKTEHYLKRTLTLAPEHEEAHNALGYFFAEHGRNLDEAVELIQKALQKSPENGAYLDSLGWAYFKQGKLNAALTELEKAIYYMPDSADIQDHLGEVYLKKGLKEKAVSAWQKAIELEPDNIVIQEKLKKYQGNANMMGVE